MNVYIMVEVIRKRILCIAIAILALLNGITMIHSIAPNVSALTVRSPIRIDWNGEFTAANGVVSGNGTEGNPWIIENYAIQSVGAEDCIYIGNTTNYCIIQNCNLIHAQDYEPFPGDGIELYNAANVVIQHCTLADFWYGIYIRDSCNNSLLNNTVNECNGIRLSGSEFNRICGNTIRSDYDGLTISTYSHDNMIENNTFYSGLYAIQISYGDSNYFNNNIMNGGGFDFYDNIAAWCTQTILPTNKVDNKPVYYYSNVNLNNSFIPLDAGQVILANVSNARVIDLVLTNTSSGVMAGYCENIEISDNIITENSYGINLVQTNHSIITHNVVYNNNFGINVLYCDGNEVLYNYVENNNMAYQIYATTNTLVHYNAFIYNPWYEISPTSYNISICHNYWGGVNGGTYSDTTPLVSINSTGWHIEDFSIDNDHNFVPDILEGDRDGDGTVDYWDNDDDNDGWSDTYEIEAGSNPCDNASLPPDLDGDGIPDLSDPDIDGDGVEQGLDAFPYDSNETMDTDHDGIGNNEDQDDDNDGYNDTIEVALGTDATDPLDFPPDYDGDYLPDEYDPDDDNDGYEDAVELMLGTDAFNSSDYPLDYDGDFIPDVFDPDDDNDGWSDVLELMAGSSPYNITDVPRDIDGDGYPDVIDCDNDNDGFEDIWEEFLGTDKFNSSSTPIDTDSDGLPDGDSNNTQPWMDTDDDGDGVPDDIDLDPLDPTVREIVDEPETILNYYLWLILIIIGITVIGTVLMLARKLQPMIEDNAEESETELCPKCEFEIERGSACPFCPEEKAPEPPKSE